MLCMRGTCNRLCNPLPRSCKELRADCEGLSASRARSNIFATGNKKMHQQLKLSSNRSARPRGGDLSSKRSALPRGDTLNASHCHTKIWSNFTTGLSISNKDIFNLLFRDLFQGSLLRIYRKCKRCSVSWLQSQVSRTKRWHNARQTECLKVSAGAACTLSRGSRPASPVPGMSQQCQPPAPAPFLQANGPLDGPSPPTVCLHSCLWFLLPLSSVESGPRSLLGVPGMAVDRHGLRLSQVCKQQPSFLKITVAMCTFQDTLCVCLLNGRSLDNLFWNHKVMQNYSRQLSVKISVVDSYLNCLLVQASKISFRGWRRNSTKADC